MSDYIDNKSNERPAVPIPPSTDTDVNTVSADDSSVHVQKENDTDVTDGKHPGKRRTHLIKCTWLRRTLKTLACLLVFILLLPAAVYIPFVQDFLIEVACKAASKSTGMQIEVDRFRLHFPLDVELENLRVIEAHGDTMVSARSLLADVKMLPLLKMDVQINRVRLLDGQYNMVSSDSSLNMGIRAGMLQFEGGSRVNLKKSDIRLRGSRLEDAKVSIAMNVWKQKKETASSPAEWVIGADRLMLKNVDFGMTMLPTIDTLGVSIGTGRVDNTLIDLKNSNISIGNFDCGSGTASYLVPTAEYVAGHPVPADSVPSSSPPMTVSIKKCHLRLGRALYATSGAVPKPGFDPSYIEAGDIDLEVSDFFNRASELRLPIRSLRAKERCGLEVNNASGTLGIDSLGIKIDDFKLATPFSNLSAQAYLSYAMMAMNPDAPVDMKLDGHLGWQDLYSFMPSLRDMLRLLPQRSPVSLDVDASGSVSSLSVKLLKIGIRNFFKLTASGSVDNPTDIKKMNASLDVDGSLLDARVGNALLASVLKGTGIHVPRFSIKGHIGVRNQTYMARLAMRSDAGDASADGTVSLNAETYDASVTAKGLNIAAIMPSLGVGVVSGHVTAEGAGFNPTVPRAHTEISADMATLVYGGHNMAPLKADAALSHGVYNISLEGRNPNLDLSLLADGTIKGNDYKMDIQADMRHVDLRALGLMADTCNGSGHINLCGTANPSAMLFDLAFGIDDIDWVYGSEHIQLPHALDGTLLATSTDVAAELNGDGLNAKFASDEPLKSVTANMDKLMAVVNRQLKDKALDMEEIQALLPPFSISLDATEDGLMGDALGRMGYHCASLAVSVCNADSIVTGNARILSAGTTSISIDTALFDFTQRGKMIDYGMHVGNRAGNMPEFASVDINGYVGGNRGSVFLRQRNAKGKMGYRLGLTAALMDSTVSVHLTPLAATIAYKPWKISEDNYIELGPGRKVRADLLAESSGSKVSLKTSETREGYTSLAVSITDVHIEDFLQMSLTAPPVAGTLNADMDIVYRGTAFTGNGTLGVAGLTYDKMRVGDIEADFKAGLGLNGNTGGSMNLYLDRQKVLMARGYMLADSAALRQRAGQSSELDLTLTRFPLRIANPFIGADMAQLSGYLNGTVNMAGTLSAPLLNGSIMCDSASVYVPMASARLDLDSASKIVVKDNVLRFNRFDIHAANDNTIALDGTVDARSFSNVLLDISLKGSDVALVNSSRKGKGDVYGKLFVNLDASARGPLDRLDIDADLSVLPSTDITYVRPTAVSALDNGSSTTDVVKFVQFADTAVVAAADSLKARTMSMRVNATLNIVNGAEVTVMLSGNGTDKVQLNPYGTLTYTQTYMGDMRLNGTLYLGTGFARYSVPVIGEKTFNFDTGSYVNWSGDIMNPTLRINATDRVRANVQQEGASSRIIYFDVALAVSGTLSVPKVTFDMSTQDDVTVQNELLSMTPEQRSAAAINLLLYNTYTGPGVKASANLSNPLYSFIEGQLNSWAAKNIRGIDLSFGIDNYKQTVEGQGQSTTTSYSYQVSKSLFDNRFKIVVGGNYSTDADADENFAQNLISDIAFEYNLKQTQTMNMYLKLFRHTGYESILEGEVTETGAGFVMKRKISSLKSLFRMGRRKKKTESVAVESSDSLVPLTTDTIIR